MGTILENSQRSRLAATKRVSFEANSRRARRLFSFSFYLIPLSNPSRCQLWYTVVPIDPSKFASYIYLFIFFKLRIRALPGTCPIPDDDRTKCALQTALERHVNGHFNQPETSNNNARRSCESGGKLVRRNGKRLRYRRQPWSGRYRFFLPPLREILLDGLVIFFLFFDSETVRLLRFRGDGGSSAQAASIGEVENARSSR